MENKTINTEAVNTVFISPDQLRGHWQGHRGLTRRVIEAFPEKELFSFSIGGMRPFSEMAIEMLGMAVPGMLGAVTDEWLSFDEINKQAGVKRPTTKAEILKMWDETTTRIDELWPQVPAEHFQDMVLAFGQYEGPLYWTILYFIDNEIHHRGQGYVYLRALGIEPPPFWDRK